MIDLKTFRTEQNISQSEICAVLGLKQPYVSSIENGKRPLNDEKFSLLYNHYGDIVLKYKTSERPIVLVDEIECSLHPETLKILQDKLNAGSLSGFTLVPIVHIDSVGGIHASNSIVGEPQYIEGYVPFTDAKDGDICIIQSGNSMTPTCPSGSLLLLRKVLNWREYFGFGSIFVIELSDGRRITKEVSRYDENPKDYIWCISHNPNVPDEELPKSMIVSVWKVIKIQIDKGW